MKRILLYTSLLFLPSTFVAQTPNWANQYTTESSTQSGYASVQKSVMAPNGDIVSVGLLKGTSNFNPSGVATEITSTTPLNDYFIMRNSPNGALISTILFTGISSKEIGLAVDATTIHIPSVDLKRVLISILQVKL